MQRKGLLTNKSHKIILLVIGCAGLLYQLFHLAGSLRTVFLDDFIAYWGVGRLQLNEQNSYSYPLISEMQRTPR